LSTPVDCEPTDQTPEDEIACFNEILEALDCTGFGHED
jgi:hypothetical protein